jgi:hypothetical protein
MGSAPDYADSGGAPGHNSRSTSVIAMFQQLSRSQRNPDYVETRLANRNHGVILNTVPQPLMQLGSPPPSAVP